MQTCFIMMPITTPANMALDYGGDLDHFTHVLDHLFIPAIEKAGFVPVRPTTTGSEIIQAHIIRNIQSADIVLCDITSLNANVFFELGIRTALNLPAVIVKDRHTSVIPFDTGIINHRTYDGTLSAWTLATEIEHLSQHLVSSTNSAAGANSLWHYFGLATATRQTNTVSSTEEKLDYALELLKSLKTDSATIEISATKSLPGVDPDSFIAVAQSMAEGLKARFDKIQIDGSRVTLDLGTYLITEELEKSILAVAPNYGVSAEIIGEVFFETVKKRDA